MQDITIAMLNSNNNTVSMFFTNAFEEVILIFMPGIKYKLTDFPFIRQYTVIYGWFYL